MSKIEKNMENSKMNPNLYEILGVREDASIEDIKKAYHIISKKYHPDMWVNADTKLQNEMEQKMKMVSEAYAILSNPLERKKYDQRKYESGTTSTYHSFDTEASCAVLSKERNIIKKQVNERKCKIRDKWSVLQQELNQDRMTLFADKYNMIEIRLQSVEFHLTQLRNQKKYQCMPLFYQNKKRRLEEEYQKLKQIYEEYKQKKQDFKIRQDQINKGVAYDLENDFQLLQLYHRLHEIEELMENLNRQNRR